MGQKGGKKAKIVKMTGADDFHHVLAIETSCDDTSLAIVRADGFVVGCLTANQDLAHRPFGGVVPEIASRNHTLQILPLLEELFSRTSWSWQKIDGIAVTNRPGLIGSLLVGVVTAKTLALVYNKPFIGVNHQEAHLLAPFLWDSDMSQSQLKFPYLGLTVSGGHTHLFHVRGIGHYELLGRTVDDAAGEALDKFAKLLGLGFPGGAKVDEMAKRGDAKKFAFPRTMKGSADLNFSFSGLKAAAVRRIESMSPSEVADQLADLCASFQEAVTESLMVKLKSAQTTLGLNRVVITGGVCANSRLRAMAAHWVEESGRIEIFMPALKYCTDNAAMVGLAGIWRLARGERSGQTLAPSAASFPEDFQV